MLLLPLTLAFQVQVGVSVGGDSASRARRAQTQAEIEAAIEEGSSRNRRPVRRIPVTDEMRRTAFRDSAAHSLVLRARVTRLQQDSALASYDATTYQRFSAGLGFKALGRDRLAMRHEDASRVQWERGRGALVEVKGSRSVIPIAQGTKGENEADAEMNGISPVPYYPGREQLWIGGGLARAEVDETQFVHPIAEGAEAYYTYASGDSVIMTLPDGTRLTLREIRIVARQPKWNLSVGSFWFDEASAHLVRAVYRLSDPIDIWALAKDEAARVRADTSKKRARDNDGDPPLFARALLSPMRVDVPDITLEYGLYNQRFWLPRAQAMEGKVQVGFMRIPVSMQQRFKYESVNALAAPLPIPMRTPARVTVLRDSLDSAKTPTVLRDSLLKQARRSRAKELTEQRERDCRDSGQYTRTQRRYEGTLDVVTRIPCDSTRLANAPELPPSIYDPAEEIFGSADREELLKSLSFGLQPVWSPQLPKLDWGLAFTRYNRVEGLSSGLTLTSVLGRGYSAQLGARGALGDRQLNGDLSLSRTNGRATLRGTAYRRLDVMNDWGTPLSLGSSLAALLYARDEGAYFRTWGGELSGTHTKWGTLDWRIFGEQQWKADVTTRWSLFGGSGDTRFIANPAAERVTEMGAAIRLHSSVGLDPDGFRLLSDLRAEAAGGDLAYTRGLVDLTMSHGLGAPLGKALAASLTTSVGYSGGRVPVQKRFYLGGLQTVRGESALAASGDAFWLVRAELGLGGAASRLIGFGDVGWAGDRRAWSKPGRPLSGVGVGTSFLDGLIRFDLARGLFPVQRWRADFYLEAKF